MESRDSTGDDYLFNVSCQLNRDTGEEEIFNLVLSVCSCRCCVEMKYQKFPVKQRTHIVLL